MGRMSERVQLAGKQFAVIRYLATHCGGELFTKLDKTLATLPDFRYIIRQGTGLIP
jgi:hypothetical protein